MRREKMICRILLLIILTSCVSGSFVVNVTQTSYQAEENHNITLEWTFTTKPGRSIETLNILCELITEHRFLLLYHVHEGVEVSESQDAKFSGRVQSDKNALREGRIRLQLLRLRTEDSGQYVCEVNTDDGFSVGRCQLNVTVADQSERETLSPKPKSPGLPIFHVMLGMGLLAEGVLLSFGLSYIVKFIKKEKSKKCLENNNNQNLIIKQHFNIVA